MRNANQIRELIAEKKAEAEAIVALAEAEDREMTADESQAFDKLVGVGTKPANYAFDRKVGVGNKDAAGYIAGEIDALEAELAQATKRDELKAKVLGERVEKGDVRVGETAGQADDPVAAIRVPAKARSRRSLKCFSGDNAEREAFMTGHFLAATIGGSKRSREFLDGHGIEVVNAMTESDSSRGGVFVPTETERAIIRQVEEHGVFRGRAQQSPMSSDRKVATVRVSGVTAYPVGETDSGTESEPTYKQVELVARMWKVITKISDNLSEDSLISLADQFVLESGLAFAFAEDNAGFNGDGTSTFHRIVGLKNALNAGSIFTPAAGKLKFADLEMADFLAMIGQLPDYMGIQPAWYISKEGYYASMAPLKQAAGGNTVVEVTGGANERQFLGYPVVWVNTLTKTLTNQASTKLCYLGDLAMAALFGDRRGITMSTSDQQYWETDQIGLKGTERFDINVFSKGTAEEAGPMIAMETPGS